MNRRFTLNHYNSATGRLWCADVGQGKREELNIIERGGHYGWNYREGTIAYEPGGTPPSGMVFEDPILDYPYEGDPMHAGKSITGGVVYRGTRMSQLYGQYVFGDYVSGNIWALDYDGAEVTGWVRLLGVSGVVSFGSDPANGDVLLVQLWVDRVRRLAYHDEPSGDPLPLQLTETGVFSDLATLTVEPGIVGYAVNAPFWSDHALKRRWFSIPDLDGRFGFDPTSNWSLPPGAVWIKHFDLDLNRGDPATRRRVETRFLIRNDEGVYGVTYRWDDDQVNAYLVPSEGLEETFEIEEDGVVRTQVWRYPSWAECLACHTDEGGLALGFNTFQLNREHDFGGEALNQLLAWSQAGYFETPVTSVQELDAMVDTQDTSAAMDHRVRSYLAVNCSYCHQPGGPALGFWDGRFSTPLQEAGIVGGLLVNDFGDASNRVIKPGSVEESMILRRISSFEEGHMPPLATSELNQAAIDLLREWVTETLTTILVNVPVTGIEYVEGADEILLAPDAQLLVPVGVTLVDGTVAVSIVENGTVGDRLEIVASGTGPGPIGVEGTVVTYEGAMIGTFAGGIDGATPLVIRLNGAATPESVEALLRSVAFENVSATPALDDRLVELSVEASGGVSSGPVALVITVVPVAEPPILMWSSPAPIVYGTALGAGQLNATANVDGSFSYEPSAGTILGVGPGQILTVSFAPDDTVHYLPSETSVAIDVQPAPLVIRAEDKVKVYGEANPALTVSYNGFVAGDGPEDLATGPDLGTSATEASPVGEYEIAVSGATSSNYVIDHQPGTLTVYPAESTASVALTVTGDLEIAVEGVPGRTFELQGSSTLTNWIRIAEAVAGPDGWVVFQIEIPREGGGGWYFRVVLGDP
jgi:hypothetical protein